MQIHRRLLLSASFALVSSPALGVDMHCVNPGGTGGCFSSIQAAVDAARPGSIIEVAAGTYAEIVQVTTRSLTIRGAGAGVTTLTGPGMPGCPVALCIDAKASVEQMTITGVFVGPNFNPRVKLTSVVLTGSSGAGLTVNPRAKVDLVRATVSGNPGGGISNNGTLTVTDSTISGNAKTIGFSSAGGISNGKRAKIVSSTISGNSAQGCGGIANLGDHNDRATMQIERSTIADNEATSFDGGGICNNDALVLRDSIVADNTAAGAGADCADSGVYRPGFWVKVSGASLIEDGAGCTTVVPGSALLLSADPLLGPLQDNGGTTLTHALSPGSPAIGVLTKAASCQKPDQRGVARTVPCDLGAYEAP